MSLESPDPVVAECFFPTEEQRTRLAYLLAQASEEPTLKGFLLTLPEGLVRDGDIEIASAFDNIRPEEQQEIREELLAAV